MTIVGLSEHLFESRAKATNVQTLMIDRFFWALLANSCRKILFVSITKNLNLAFRVFVSSALCANLLRAIVVRLECDITSLISFEIEIDEFQE